MVKKIYENFKKLKSLSPSKETNKVFSELVNYCISNDTNIEYNDLVKGINNYCSKWEYELEKYTTEKILSSSNPKEELKRFEYYQNYEKLAKFEYTNSKLLIDKIKNVLFIWWWPLPLTSIILYYKYWIKSVIVDFNSEAIDLSRKLIKKLKLNNYIKVIHWDAKTYKNTKNYDLCYIASLVFWSNEHKGIIENIKKIDFKLLLTRTSHRTRQLLYKKVDENILKQYFNIQLIIHPKNEIVNSIILSYKK